MSSRPVARLAAHPAFRIVFALCLLLIVSLYVARRPQAKGAQESAPPRQPTIPIQPGQPLPVALNNQSATLLPDGRVLVAGGSTNGQPSGSRREAYLYNPATGLWTPTGSLITARYVHFSVLLQSGKVLVGGGANGTDGVLRSGELYDPVAGTWQPTGALGGARYGATGTLISFASNVPGAPSGFVLVVGGRASTTGATLNTSELYNPATGVWRPTGTNLRDTRTLHAAVVLPDGTILVTGGYSTTDAQVTYVASAETFDPVTERWASAGSMSVGRENATVTLLHNGRVLATGGRGPNGTLSSAELFNPVNRTWAATPNMNAARERHTATLLPNGRLLIAGGLVQNGVALASTEIYDPAAQRWDNAFTLSQARGTHAAVLLANARVLLIAGTGVDDESTALSSVDIHDPAAGFWQTQSGPNTKRFAHTTTLLPSGKVLIVGGRNASNAVTASAELYDPASGAWSNTGSLNGARECHTATLLNNGLVLVAGGLAGGPLNSAELYEPGSGAWRRVTATLVRARGLHTATLLPDGRVLLAGGQVGANSEQTTELFNPANESFAAAGSMRSPRNGHTATLLFDGRVLVTGGFPLVGSQTSQNTAELYTPGSDSWALTSSAMTVGRYGHTATLLPNGRVLVVAGLRGSNFAIPTIISGSAELFDPGPQSWATTSTPEGRYTHTATLLPNGKVLIAGGAKLNGATPVVELYDPARGTSLPFETLSNAPLATARDLHTATLLPNGKVLIVGGETGGDFVPANANELFDVGLGSAPLSAPGISEGLWSGPGNPVCLGGIRFQGLSEAASGGFQGSATNYPIAQLRRLDNEQTLHLLPDLSASACGANRGWTNNSYTSRAITASTTNGGTGNLHPGTALLTVFVNGVPNTRSVVIAPPNAAVGGTPVVSVTGRIFTIDDAGFPASVELLTPNGQSLGVQQTNTNGEYIFEDVPSPNVGNITGTVRNASNNQPLANATVTSSGISATTASNGAYTLSNVPAGSRTVNVTATGFNSAQATVTVVIGQTVTRDFSLTATPTTGIVTGTVVNAANNQTIAGATVRVVSTNQTATTSANGAFTLTSVPAGTQTLSTSATGFTTFAGTVNVLAGQTISVTIGLQPTVTTGTVTGTVINASNSQAIAGATIAVANTALTATTGGTGAFTLNNVPAGTQTLIISATGFTGIQGTVNVVAGQTINLQPIALQPIVTTGAVTGTVRNGQTGLALAGAVVAISGTNFSTTSNSSGVYTLTNITPGARTLTASASGFTSASVAITVTAGQTLTQSLSLSPILPTGQLRITVNWNRDQNGAPLDLDAHLTGPQATTCFHVFYGFLGSLTAAPFAQLEVDNRFLNQPSTETIRIAQTSAGTYRFFIRNFSNESATGISASSATVQVFDSSTQIFSRTVPAGASGRYWHVFDLNGQTRAITVFNQVSNTDPSTCGVSSFSGGATVARKAQPYPLKAGAPTNVSAPATVSLRAFPQTLVAGTWNGRLQALPQTTVAALSRNPASPPVTSPTHEEEAQQQGTYTITPSGTSPRGNRVIFFPPVVPIIFDNPGGAPGARAVRAPLAGNNGSSCAQTTTNNQISGLLSPLSDASGVSVRLTITNQKAECGLPVNINANLTSNGLTGFNYTQSGLALNGNYRIEPLSGNHRFMTPGGGAPDRNVNQLDGPALMLDFIVQPNVVCPANVSAAVNGQPSVQVCENQTVNLTTPAIPARATVGAGRTSLQPNRIPVSRRPRRVAGASP